MLLCLKYLRGKKKVFFCSIKKLPLGLSNQLNLQSSVCRQYTFTLKQNWWTKYTF